MGILGRNAVRELVHVRLAKKNGAGLGQASGHFAVPFRNKFRQDFRARGCPDSARPKIILERDRDSVQRPPRSMAVNLPLRQTRLSLRAFGEDRKEWIER